LIEFWSNELSRCGRTEQLIKMTMLGFSKELTLFPYLLNKSGRGVLGDGVAIPQHPTSPLLFEKIPFSLTTHKLGRLQLYFRNALKIIK